MFGRLLFLFITIPIVEFCLLLYLGSRIGFPITLAIIVITGFLGAYLTKSQGLKALHRYQEALANGRLPHEEVMDGLMILIAGAVLLTPGFLTDAIGFSLLIPPVRNAVRGALKGYLKNKVTIVGQSMGAEPPKPGADQVITVDAEIVEDIPGERVHNSGE